jgi:hypothetical protein
MTLKRPLVPTINRGAKYLVECFQSGKRRLQVFSPTTLASAGLLNLNIMPDAKSKDSDASPPVCSSGMGSFHWFHTRAEPIEFIRNCLAWWNPATSSMQPAEIAAQVQVIVEAESDDRGAMVDRLNELMRKMWQTDWCG